MLDNSTGITLPSSADLVKQVHFSPEHGKIWLDEQRSIMQTIPSLASSRNEIIKSVGNVRARGLYMRAGYRNGKVDAELARKSRPKASITDMFLAGPQLHMLRGMVRPRPIQIEIDPANNHYLLDFVWEDSYEVDISLAEYGVVGEPVCWNLLGYACGFSSNLFGTDILFKEVSCKGKGDSECRVIGKPLSEWDDAGDNRIFSSSDSLLEALHDAQAKVGLQSPEKEDERIFSTLVGESTVIKNVCQMANKVANSKASVLLLGETGVGKEIIAKGIHVHSSRAEQPFVALNCAAIPQELLEAELFGVEKGAYTGATHSRQGRFERAHKGTIFLDEVVELSARAQATLLRVLQESEFEPVGGTITRRVDVRIIAATNEDLEDAVRSGKFRADLFYRLNVFPLHIPPLRERAEDIPLLARFFVNKYESFYTKRTLGLSDKAMSLLIQYHWPGNIRELENAIERGIILTDDHHRIQADAVLPGIAGSLNDDIFVSIDGLNTLESAPNTVTERKSWVDEIFEHSISLDEVESMLIQNAIALATGNVSMAARMLGLSRPAFAYRMRKLNNDNNK